jgi:hypothetical protein
VDEDLEDNNPFSIPRIPEEDEDLREESSTSLARKGSEGNSDLFYEKGKNTFER